MFVAGCAAGAATSEAFPEVVVEGVLLVVYGDPVGLSGSPGYLFTLAEPTGETHRVVPDSAAGMTAEILRGFDRQRVRAVGVFRRDSADGFVVRLVEALPVGLSEPRVVPNTR